MALAFAQGLPRTTTCVVRSAEGLSRIGFMATSGSTIAAEAWEAWARPISAPSRVTKELSAMFWALNGATLTPSRASQRQMPATTTLFPASEWVPAMSRAPLKPPRSCDGHVYKATRRVLRPSGSGGRRPPRGARLPTPPPALWPGRGRAPRRGRRRGRRAARRPCRGAGRPRPRAALVAGNAEQVSPVVGELVQVVEGTRGLPQERREQSPAGREEHKQREEQQSKGEPTPQRQGRRMSPSEDLLHRCLLLGVLAPVWNHGRKASLLTPGSLLTRPSRACGGPFGFAPQLQWRDRAGLAPASWVPSPPACPRAA